jgi:hypothetical protein
MAEYRIEFHNEAEIRVQAQIFAGRLLHGTCVLDPGESYVLLAEPRRYDIFLKNGTTGWELARKLDCEDTDITLCREKGRYVLLGSRA